MEQQTSKNSAARAAIEWVESLAFATALLLLVFVFFIRAVTVSGSSMESTLLSGDKILVRSIGYTPKRGDVIVVDGYTEYGEPLVKRIIALGGDTVDIDFETSEVWVNGTLLEEPYLGSTPFRQGDVTFPLTVPQGTAFVMGDNRRESLDSRDTSVGFIDTRDILGKVFFRIFPFSSIGVIR
ncbi:MAG TPA: signal peptidase I [Candidatus Pygmaiobacter gallistercoris]|nr:signal peptidase I [Candidatus Pygmaiobacter gallistercoris]